MIGGVALIARGVQRDDRRFDGLEAAERAAGRPKDLLDLGYIRALRR